MTEATQTETWAIVEVMGHQTYAGKLSEQTIGGAAFVRVDIPDTDGQPGFTKLFSGGSIYAITPTTEPIARSVAERVKARALTLYDLPQEWRDAIADRKRALPEPQYESPEHREYEPSDFSQEP